MPLCLYSMNVENHFTTRTFSKISFISVCSRLPLDCTLTIKVKALSNLNQSKPQKNN